MSNPYRDYRGMAYAAGIGFWEDGSLSPAIERFAALVAAAARAEENEACAKVCDGMDHNGVMIAADCAAIRARGNT